MTIKEFSHKHSLVFFWATVVLAILLLLTTCFGGRGYYGRGYMMMREGYGYDRFDKKMMNNRPGTNIPGAQRQIMNPNYPNQPLINDTPNTAGTVETGVQVDPNIPVEVQ